MRKTNRAGRKSGRRPSSGDGGPDLFSKQLSEVVEQAFAKAGESSHPADAETQSQEGEGGVKVPAMLQGSEDGGKGGPETGESSDLAEVESQSREERHEEPAFAVRAEAGVVPVVDVPLELIEFPKIAAEVDPLPARMLNEFVYCPRLFYYEHVEGVFVESADTVKGSAVHARVDKGKGVMPKAKGKGAKDEGQERPESENRKSESSTGAETEDRKEGADTKAGAEREEIHSRSVMLGSERLGVVAKMDLVETTLDGSGEVERVCPVDYKVGSPREGEDGRELWDTDKMQLGLQCLVLRDNGYACDAGIIYYRGTKQRVRLELTPELEAWVIEQIAKARRTAAGPIPPPLIDSPKCARCSLAPVCLPDETRMLSLGFIEAEEETGAGVDTSPATTSPSSAPRRLIASRDEKRALYLNTQGFRIGCNDLVLKVKEKDRVVEEVRVNNVCHVAIFGNIQVSTQAVQRLCDRDIPVTWFSMGGWFYGITRGHSLKNVLVRIAQFRHADDPESCLRLAKQFVRGKIHNHRVLFMRDHAAPPERTKLRLGQARADAMATRSLEELLGVEGAAASEYFAVFSGMIRERVKDEDFLEGIAPPETSAQAPAANGQLTFDFTTRNRRPPTDPVNALLSLAYSLLAKECTLAAYAVGLDPYIGFYHQPRHGRPALALDIMEEFRPIIAESTVITAINNRFISTKDFVTAGRAVNLSPEGRKGFFQCFEQRMNSLINHPIFDYKVSYRRALELQFRILARVLTGEIPEYTPFLTR
jgi:CRISPR-associated protein Cas1